jgi:hypothetical protein
LRGEKEKPPSNAWRLFCLVFLSVLLLCGNEFGVDVCLQVLGPNADAAPPKANDGDFLPLDYVFQVPKAKAGEL